MMIKQCKKIQFTLIELLVVLSVILILFALLVPALNRAKEMTDSNECKRRLRMFGLAQIQYMGDNAGYVPGAHRWTTDLKPYVPEIIVNEPDQQNKAFDRRWYCPSAIPPWYKNGIAYCVSYFSRTGSTSKPWKPTSYIMNNRDPSELKYLWDSKVVANWGYVSSTSNAGSYARHNNMSQYNALFWDYRVDSVDP